MVYCLHLTNRIPVLFSGSAWMGMSSEDSRLTFTVYSIRFIANHRTDWQHLCVTRDT